MERVHKYVRTWRKMSNTDTSSMRSYSTHIRYIISIAVDLNNAPPLCASITNAHPIVMREVNPYNNTGILSKVENKCICGIDQASFALTGNAMPKKSNTSQQNTNRNPTKIMVMSEYPIRIAL
jgi:hypothetical protein